MIDEAEEAVITDVVLMHYVGMRPIGARRRPRITDAMKRMGKSRFSCRACA